MSLLDEINAFSKKKKMTNIKGGDEIGVVERIPSLPCIDYLTDGGLPKGRVTIFTGNSGGGKSTAAAQIVANNQKLWKERGEEKVAIWVDLERSANREYFERVGIDFDYFLLFTPNSAEETADGLFNYVNHFGDKIGIVVIDSFSNFTSEKEMESNLGDHVIAGQAGPISRFLRKATPIFENSGTTILGIAQYRANMDAAQFGPKKKMSGGQALEYFASVIIEFSRIGNGRKEKGGSGYISNKVRATIKKSRFSTPNRSFDTEIIFGKGFSAGVDLRGLGEQYGVLKSSGSSWKMDGNLLAVGKDNMADLLESDENLYREVQSRILEAARSGEEVVVMDDDQEDDDEGVDF